MKKNVFYRALALLLCPFLAAACALSPAASLPPARASAAASAEAAAEMFALVYSLLETAAVSAGAAEGLGSYESGSSLVEAFLEFAGSATNMMGRPYCMDMEFALSDGSVVTWEECNAMLDAALQQPDAGELERMLYVAGLLSGGDGGGAAPEPGKGPGDSFTRLQEVSIGAGSSLVIASFFEKAWAGEVENVSPGDYLGEHYGGSYAMDAAGNYEIRGSIDGTQAVGGALVPAQYVFSGTLPFRPALYLEGGKLFLMAWDGAAGPLIDRPPNSYPGFEAFRYGESFEGGTAGGRACGLFAQGFGGFLSYSFNIPVFGSRDAAAAFLQGGGDAPAAGTENASPYDYAALAAALSETLAPLLGKALSPGQALGVNAAVSKAAEALPEPGPDPAANADAYRQAVSDAVADAVPDAGAGQEPAAGTEAAKKYGRDLTLIFPFCIPFDLVHFFEVMNAEPVAPCFHIPFKVEPLGIDMDVELDMAFLEPAMKVFRMGELGLFIIGLILATSKTIRW